MKTRLLLAALFVLAACTPIKPPPPPCPPGWHVDPGPLNDPTRCVPDPGNGE